MKKIFYFIFSFLIFSLNYEAKASTENDFLFLSMICSGAYITVANLPNQPEPERTELETLGYKIFNYSYQELKKLEITNEEIMSYFKFGQYKLYELINSNNVEEITKLSQTCSGISDSLLNSKKIIL